MAVDSVLLVTSDQQRADTLGAYGSAMGATPALDRLAAAGVTFTDAVCQHPYCQPSRWTLLTGLHPRGHGVWTNGVDPPDEVIPRGLAARAAAAGVRTAFVGKAHFATNGVLRRSRSRHAEALVNAARLPADWTGPYMGFDHVELIQLGHFPFGYGPAPLGLHYGRWLGRDGRRAAWRHFLDASPARKLPSSPRAPQTWHAALPEALHPTTWVADRTIEALRARRDAPFFVWASFPDPHHPLDPPAPWCHRFAARDMPLPRRDPAELDGKPPWQGRFSRGLGPWARALNVAGGRLTDAELGAMSAAYHGMVAQIDHAVGRILGAVDDLGLAGRTAVVFTSDHGELMGDHGLMFKGPFHYQGLLRVPLVVRAAGWAAGARVDDPVGLVDLAPTLARWLGAALPRAHGRDLDDVVAGRRHPDAAITENDHRIGFREHVQTVTTAAARLSRHVGRPYGELYLRDDDPGEHVNRWDDRPALRRDLEALLDERLPPWEVAQRPPVSRSP
ncbi:MAG: sulfatase-like hydrolase/transferase, partial [Myxococcales bacterium]|nr:sulfatase-like hydrolase/transferase [Myxococcales bacterium]